MREICLAIVASLLFADVTPAADAAAAPVATAPAKPTASAPTVAEVKAPSAEQLKLNRCNAEADGKKLAGDARKAFVADCLKAR